MRNDFPSHPSPRTRLGLLWFVPNQHGRAVFLQYSRPWLDVPEIGGFRTLDEGHVEIWAAHQRSRPELRGCDYDDFPRGRANWRAEDARFLLLLDRRLHERAFLKMIVEAWRLPLDRLTVLADAHYKSRKPIGHPVEGVCA